MARGWESKSIDMQIEEHERALALPPGNKTADAGRKREVELLALTRERLLQEIEGGRDPRLKEMKRRALSFIDGRIGGLNQIAG